MNKKIYIGNSTTSLALLLVNVIFSVFFIAFFVRTFGLENFSSLSILLQISAAFILLNSPLNTALARLVISDEENSANYFYTVLLCTFFMFVIALLVSLFFSNVFFDDYLNMLLFLGGTFFFCLSLNENVYLFKRGSLYVQNLLQICNITTRVFLFFLFSLIFEPVLSFSASFFGVNLCHYFVMRYHFCKGSPRSSVTDIKLSLVLNNSKYLFVNSLGAVLIRNLDLMLIFYFVNAVESGKYSLYLQLIALIRLFTEALAGSMAPKIMSDFIKKSDNSMNVFFIFLKFLSYIVSMFALLVMLNVDLIWSAWIGDSVSLDKDIIYTLVVSSGLTGGFYVFSYVQNALNKNKIPALSSLAFGFTFIGFGVFVLYYELTLFLYALSFAFILIAKNLLFSAYYNSIICNGSFFKNLKALADSLIPSLLSGAAFFLLTYTLILEGAFYYVVQIVVLFFSIFIFFYYSLSKEEKIYLIKALGYKN